MDRVVRTLALFALLSAISMAPATSATHLVAQTALPMGTTGEGTVTSTGAAEYSVQVDQPGFLTIVARSRNGEDIRLILTDDEGQVMPEGTVDMDIGGDVGAEQTVMTLPAAGAYLVRVETFGMQSASFSIGGSFLASPLVGGAPDADGKPSGAQTLAIGADHMDVIDPAFGDAYDWYRFEASEAGVLTVLTRSDEGDLALEMFAEGEYGEPLQTSDQDQGGSLGNESITTDVTAGQVVYVRVGPSYIGSAGATGYRIASGIIPE